MRLVVAWVHTTVSSRIKGWGGGHLARAGEPQPCAVLSARCLPLLWMEYQAPSTAHHPSSRVSRAH
jgi:hypothetical protein